MCGLFKKQYNSYYLPFRIIKEENDDETLLINLEAYGEINNKMKYFYAVYYCKTVEMYDELKSLFSYTAYKLVKVDVNVKRVNDFKIDLENLSQSYNNSNIKNMELLGWGANDKSVGDRDII